MDTVAEGLEGLRRDAAAQAPDCVIIRGVQLPLDSLVDPVHLRPDSVAALRQQFRDAQPFPHLVLDGLFHPDLLDLVNEEFERLDASRWRRSYDGQHERTLRSLPKSRLGHAAELYFGLLHSGRFVDYLERISGIEGLIPDAHLHDGGFHESRRGGRFRVHTDFNKHMQTRLDNELVLITYLNRDWNPAWRGALELWGAEPRECLRRIEPVFGRTFLMREGPLSFHGHPAPLELPAGHSRRSVAAYFYSNRPAAAAEARRVPTQFMDSSVARRLRIAAREITPPLLWKALKRLVPR
jgi:Rps23 Pro-64 3,4-dihydroxylase Tpa1-like proline 4-hydroxylase